MKSLTEYLTFRIPARVGFVNITPQVEEVVRRSGVQEGLALCNAMHITASAFINDDEAGLHEDYKEWLEKLAPFDASPQTYAHNRTGEDNADAHLKRQVMGREVAAAVTGGKLDFEWCPNLPWRRLRFQGCSREIRTPPKLRLFLVASARLVWDRIPEGEAKDAVIVAEGFADGLVQVDQLHHYRGRFYSYVMRPGAPPEQTEWIRAPDMWPVFTLVRMTTYSDRMLRMLPTNEKWRDRIQSYHPALPPILRDIFGPLPFRPVIADPYWLTPTVTGLASAIYAERVFDRLPILADCLEEAGCDDEAILNHCRRDAPHVRGCHVLDSILGKC